MQRLVRAFVLAALFAARARAAASPPDAQVFLVDDETRLRRADAPVARALGQAMPAGAATAGAFTLDAFRGETVAFQIAVLAGSAAIARAGVSLSELTGPGGARLRPALFRQHYLPVRLRSHNDRFPGESLGWLAAARPPDGAMLGDVPDPLIPIDLDATAVQPEPAVPAGQLGAFWIDVFVPDGAPVGAYRATAEVAGDGAVLARFTVELRVLPPVLPYRAASVFVFYEADRLGKRMGASAAVEPQLWRLLHAHHVDALAPLGGADDLARVRSALDGSLFSAGGYDGPGAGLPPAVVALGAYGALRDPEPDALARADQMAAALPPALRDGDVFLYADDESCQSPRGADWKRALAGRAAGRRVQVGWTCGDPPERQPVDIALLPAPAYGRGTAAAARAAGRRAWIYGGVLPRTGTLLLDADPRGLTANGWIAAAMGIERWFYWESIYWDDDNRGGHGPVDPFATPETFHNRDGDTALGDGVLLYPGRQRGRFAARSLGYDGVLPSLRLKALRRGVEDAGIIALAARARPEDAARLVAAALPAALDEAPAGGPASWDGAPMRFGAARAALRALVAGAGAGAGPANAAAPMTAAEVHAALDQLAARRARAIPLARAPWSRRRMAAVAVATCALAGLTVAVALVLTLRRRRKPAR